MHKIQIYFASLIILLSTFPAFAQNAKLAQGLPAELSGLPGTAELFESNEQLKTFITKSAAEAEKFRQSFLAIDKIEPGVVTLARLVQKFRALHAAQTEELSDVRSTFHISNREFINGFRGTIKPVDGDDVYAAFAGKWQGYWRERIVRHHWSDLIKPKGGISYQASNVDALNTRYSVSSYQYAWIGDGYGLNLVANEKKNNETRHYLLGYVEHLKDGNFDQITARRPHVGINMGEGKLVWVTAREVFFEESFSDSYSIIGFSYSTSDDAMIATEGFQTLYRRVADESSQIELPKFRSFKVPIREQRRPAKN